MNLTPEQPDNTARRVVGEVLRSYADLKLGFTDNAYWDMISQTYIRTVQDVITCFGGRFGATARPPSGVSILEIGAFSGIVSTALRRLSFKVTAQDMELFMSDPVLRDHFRREGIETIASNLGSLAIVAPDSSFDMIVCCEVLEHLNFNPIPLLKEFGRVLKRDGLLYLATPNQANIVKRLLLLKGRSIHDPVERLEWQLDPTKTFSIGLHWREYTASELEELLRMTGFTQLDHSYCHYNDRSKSATWRRALVTAMYRVFPSFLPGQIIIGRKNSAVHA